MNTPSHFILAAAARKAMPKVRMPAGAVLIGSIAPDIPLYVLCFGALIYFRVGLDWSTTDAMRHMFDTLFFENAGWIACHNVLHSPFVLVLGLIGARMLRNRRPRLSRWLNWFLISCLFHTAVDVFTHYDDGPLLLWPLDWTGRFYSPISYWDSSHFGRQFALFELILDVALIGYLVLPRLRRFFVARRDAQTSKA